MQSRILQVTQLGNFSPGFPCISSMTTIGRLKDEGYFVPSRLTARSRGCAVIPARWW